MAATPSSPRGAALDLRAARRRLLDSADLRGAALRARLTALADEALAEWLGEVPGAALVAVGGYGRCELVPGSDLDVLLVYDGRAGVAAVADRLWYPLWDAGLDLDHSVRTGSQARAVARADLRAALGLLSARHVAGDPELTGALLAAVRADWRRQAPRRLLELVAGARERAGRAGALGHLLEPDLKDSAGGLRDVQAMTAAAAAWVVDPPSPAVGSAYSLLLDVRGELHRQSGRRSDRLRRQEQPAVSAALGYPDAEALLVAVYGAARTISHAAEHCWYRVGQWASTAGGRRVRGAAPAPRRPLGPDVVEQAGEVVLARAADPAADPWLVLRVAAAAAVAGLPIAPEAVQRLAAAPPGPEPWPAGARDSFLALLGAGAAAVPVLEALDQAGLLVRLLPEWAGIRHRPQHNPVHRFTVDRHLVESAVQATALTRRVARPDLLLLAALGHDLGKRPGVGDHAVAGARLMEALGTRLGLPVADVRRLGTLTRHHLLLVQTATRRDLADPATVAQVAAAVGDRENLELLHALTEADARATGPGVWTGWKAELVAELGRRVQARLAGRAPDPPARLSPAARTLAARPGVGVAVSPGPLLEVTVAADDRPGLLWRAAGVLALHRLTVRTATAGTVAGRAVSTFGVEAAYGRQPDLGRLVDDLRRALEGRLEVAERLRAREAAYPPGPVAAARPDVRFLPDAASTAAVVEVRAHDAPGLLYRLARALAGCGLDVLAARVSTFGAEAVDAFYVLGPHGDRLTDPRARDAVRAAVLAALAPAAD